MMENDSYSWRGQAWRGKARPGGAWQGKEFGGTINRHHNQYSIEVE